MLQFTQECSDCTSCKRCSDCKLKTQIFFLSRELDKKRDANKYISDKIIDFAKRIAVYEKKSSMKNTIIFLLMIILLVQNILFLV